MNPVEQLQQEIQEYERKLQDVIAKQQELRDLEQLAASVLEYNEIERNISDRTKVFELLSSHPDSLLHPMVKADFFRCLEAAETVNTALVDVLVDDFHRQVQAAIANGDTNTADLIEADYKEYVIPGKLIAEKFTEVDALLSEMLTACQKLDPQYDVAHAKKVLVYAFEKAIAADTRMEPTIHALQNVQFQFLDPVGRATLMERVNEHVAALRFEEAKNQNIAMEKAVQMRDAQDQRAQTA